MRQGDLRHPRATAGRCAHAQGAPQTPHHNQRHRAALAHAHGSGFACPITTGIFASIPAQAAEEASAEGKARSTANRRTLKAGGELNPKYPGGVERQRLRLEAEGHRVVGGRNGWSRGTNASSSGSELGGARGGSLHRIRAIRAATAAPVAALSEQLDYPSTEGDVRRRSAGIEGMHRCGRVRR